MTKKEARKLPLGLYKIYWKAGGYSLAAIGQLWNGDKWIAPTNWTNKCVDGICNTEHWGSIERVEMLYTRIYTRNK